MSKTIAQQVKERIEDLTAKRTADLDLISNRQSEAQERLKAAEIALHDAAESMDINAYEKALTAKRKAQTEIDMYAAKYEQIQRQEYVTEAESDAVIDSLLDYETNLTVDFESAIAEPLKQLQALLDKYREEINSTEWIIQEWTGKIHYNYLNRFGGTYSNGSRRSPQPIPVRGKTYGGCEASQKVNTFLRDQMSKYLPR